MPIRLTIVDAHTLIRYGLRELAGTLVLSPRVRCAR